MKTLNKNYELQYNRRDDSSLKVSGIIYVQTENCPDWSFSLHSHEDALELSLILNGAGKLYYNGKPYHVEQGDLVIKRAAVLHAEETDRKYPMEQICMNLSGVRTSGIPHNSLLSTDASPIVKTGNSFLFLKQLFLYVMNLYEHRPDGFEVALHDTLKALLSSIMLLLPVENNSAADTSIFPFIKNIVEYINENYMKNISLESLSKRFYFSPYYIARKFKDETGYTVNQYVINRRMGEAERMLVFENYSIRDIALKTGYANIQYFYATFKKYTGCTPVEYKNLYIGLE